MIKPSTLTNPDTHGVQTMPQTSNTSSQDAFYDLTKPAPIVRVTSHFHPPTTDPDAPNPANPTFKQDSVAVYSGCLIPISPCTINQKADLDLNLAVQQEMHQ